MRNIDESIQDQLDSLRELQRGIYQRFSTERIRQNEKFTDDPVGVQAHSIYRWLSILMEEVGESSQAALDIEFKGGDVDHLVEELVQVGALTVAILERILSKDKNLFEGEVYD